MKLAKNRSILLVIAMILVLSLSAGMTFAYFSDHTEAKGDAKISLSGKTEIVEKYDEDQKVVSIKNIGDTDVLVRVAIYAPADTEITYSDSDWIKIGDYYYYKDILEKDATTKSDITASISGPEGVVENFDVVVVNECIPVTYEGDSIYIPDDWAQDFLSN